MSDSDLKNTVGWLLFINAFVSSYVFFLAFRKVSKEFSGIHIGISGFITTFTIFIFLLFICISWAIVDLFNYNRPNFSTLESVQQVIPEISHYSGGFLLLFLTGVSIFFIGNLFSKRSK